MYQAYVGFISSIESLLRASNPSLSKGAEYTIKKPTHQGPDSLPCKTTGFAGEFRG